MKEMKRERTKDFSSCRIVLRNEQFSIHSEDSFENVRFGSILKQSYDFDCFEYSFLSAAYIEIGREM